MKRLIYSLLVCALLLAGCSGPHVSVDPEWKEAPARFTVLTTAPFTSNADDITDDFGDQDVFRQWFVSYLDTALAISSPVSHSVKIIDDGALEMELMNLGGVKVKIPVPVAAKLDGVDGLVLVVHPVLFRRYEMSCPSGGCLNNKELILQVAYSVVSLEAGRILAYGVANSSDSFSFAMTRGNWEKVVQRLSWKLVAKTPLEN